MIRADLALRRFVSWAVAFAADSNAPTLAERADAGIYRTSIDSERGDTGIGFVTARKLTSAKNLPTIMRAVERQLATQIIAEGC